ncbi:phenylalanine--tRNA ligase subunit beta [Christensenella tenuis]|uniref:Phenylalanine--tRNA ligase beta subunit n=1 Tax=Christensenella tenuis TaxID=2763033 RepID=A0ABR7EHQ5_9FIRM|nr:phenylalanine--tRNA ligase subunit beta [Christensenella tenuis]MBC5649297.1 phenylalanine--tRNA ligase subunit beta [Christensenella tenuis]
MLAPYRWICDYADVKSDADTLADKMVMTGNGVEEVVKLGENIQNVVVGRIEKITKHPDADKLQICMIDVGGEDLLQIVTGADNVFEGAYIPVAKAPSMLPAGPIKKGKLRGVESFGMLCSGEELNLKEEDYPGAGVNGIMILAGEPAVGTDIRELLNLSGTVIDFEVGANRPDCLSMIGTAREASAADQVAFHLPEIKYDERQDIKTEDLVSVDIQAADLCTRYIAAAVTDVVIGPSPEWMRVRLREAGIRPINNIVDITNFVMLETGQPMHAFDASKIRGKKIVVRRAENGEKMKTLDDKERTFTENMLLICDQEGPIGVAGVMGGLDSEITDQTKTVVFESAKFMYGNIRQTSRGLGLSTESSMRFSKGVDAATTMFAMQRALTLINELGAGKVANGMIDVLNEDLKQKVVKVNAARINAKLGTEISAKEMQQYLNRVFIQTGIIGDELVCTIPAFRGDIYGMADIAEEVARIYGYDNIPETDALTHLRRGRVSDFEAKTDVVRDYLRDTGFFECVTYSFAGPQDYAKIGMDVPESVKIINPLGDDTSLMRTTLVPHMLSVVALNQNRKNENVQLFEVSRGYFPQDGEPLPHEVPMIVLAQAGSKDFFDMKGVVENIVRLASGAEIRCERADEPYLHPGISADIFVGEEKIGVMGSVHPDTMKLFDMPERAVIAQIDLEKLYAAEKPEMKFRALPKFPAATRDLAVIVDQETGAGDLKAAMEKAGGKRVEKVELFDVFSGEQVGAGKKSVAYAITMRSPEGTMRDEDVDAVMKKILKVLEKDFGAQLRQ